MRYLATVQRKQVFGGAQQLQLHSKEVDKYCWTPVKGEVETELAHPFKSGTLVIVHITSANQRVQRVEEAAVPIVSTLHGFSSLGRRCKDLEADIGTWRQSMEIQIQELQRREADLLHRAEGLNLELSCSLSREPEVPASLSETSELNLQT